MDPNLRDILIACSKGKSPSQFKVSKGKIITLKNNTYDIPTDPMDLCNLIHDIMHGQERATKPIIIEPSSSRTLITGISDDAIFSYTLRESKRLGRDDHYSEQLRSCIYTALLLENITYRDFVIVNGRISSINGIDTSIPSIEKK